MMAEEDGVRLCCCKSRLSCGVAHDGAHRIRSSCVQFMFSLNVILLNGKGFYR